MRGQRARQTWRIHPRPAAEVLDRPRNPTCFIGREAADAAGRVGPGDRRAGGKSARRAVPAPARRRLHADRGAASPRLSSQATRVYAHDAIGCGRAPSSQDGRRGETPSRRQSQACCRRRGRLRLGLRLTGDLASARMATTVSVGDFQARRAAGPASRDPFGRIVRLRNRKSLL